MVQPQENFDATLSAADTHEVEPEKYRHLSSRGWRYAFNRVVRDFFPEGLLDLAALLTYFTVLSLAPALLVVYSSITLVLASDTLEILTRVKDVVNQFVPEEQHELVLGVVDSVAGSAAGGKVGLIVGVLIALWTSSAYVRAFSRCANSIYNRTEGRGILRQTGAMLLTNIGLLIGSVLILISLVINETLVDRLLAPIAEPLRLGRVLEFLTDTFLPIWVWAKWPFILMLLISLVSMLYYFTPNVKPWKFRLLSVGSVTAIIGIIVAGGALNIYFTIFASFNSYGAVGSVMALLIGMWIINTVLLLGVKIDAEVGRARQLQAGIPAEVYNQVPPRSIDRVAGMKENQEKLIAKGREFRISSTQEIQDGEDEEKS